MFRKVRSEGFVLKNIVKKPNKAGIRNRGCVTRHFFQNFPHVTNQNTRKAWPQSVKYGGWGNFVYRILMIEISFLHGTCMTAALKYISSSG